MTSKNASHWAWMINTAVTNDLHDVTDVEATRAVRVLRASKGEDYARSFLLNADMSYRKWLDSDDVAEAARLISASRK